MRRALFLVVFLLLSASWAAADGLRLERLDRVAASADPAALLAAEDHWLPVPEGALRRQSGPSWWRVHLPASASASADQDWVLTLKEAYDGELVAYLGSDTEGQRLATFDPSAQQLGSRHRLAVTVPAARLSEPIHLHFQNGKRQPVRLAAMPVSQYLQEDANRVRITSALLSAQLLLGLVAAIYALALRRTMLLLLVVWVASTVLYLLVMSGEITMLFGSSVLVQQAMRINNAAIGVGLLCAYGFMLWFLEIPRYYPRLARLIQALLLLCTVSLGVLQLDPASRLFMTVNNLITISLGLLTLGAGVARALAGSPQGWFYLIGWGSLSVLGLYRASRFLRNLGTPDWLEVAHPLAYTLGALVLVLATARAARYAERELHVARAVARTDPLTGLANRGQLSTSLESQLQNSARTAQPLCVMFLDLDHFKQVNDRFGHDIGDQCLQACAQILKARVRSSDLLARYGGEEFVLVLPGTRSSGAIELAETLRAAVAAEGREVAGRPVALSLSIGVAEWQPGESAAQLLVRADAALYRAKHEGRNRVVYEQRAEIATAPLPA